LTSLTWEQDPETIFLHTDSLEVVVHKSPFSLSFHTRDGQVINEDEKGLGTSWLGEQVTTYKKLQEGERFIGLGEKTGNLDRAGNAYTNWNSDVYGYSVSQDPLYSSIPFYIGLHHDLCYGLFLDNSYRTEFNFGASNNRFSSFGAYGGEMNYYLMSIFTMAADRTAWCIMKMTVKAMSMRKALIISAIFISTRCIMSWRWIKPKGTGPVDFIISVWCYMVSRPVS
jgi:alpha-glucosidase